MVVIKDAVMYRSVLTVLGGQFADKETQELIIILLQLCAVN